MPTEQLREDVIQLPDHLQAEVQRICILIAHYESMLGGLQRELAQLLRVGIGIDVSQPGWHLDPIGGVIAHRYAVPAESSHEPAESEPA